MSTNGNIVEYIRDKYETLSKSHKKIADYIFNDCLKASQLSAANLGKQCGVSESSVTRFAGAIGLSGFQELSKKLASVVCEQEVNVSLEPVNTIMDADIISLKETFEGLDEEVTKSAISLIEKAKTVYVLGIMDSAVLANYIYNGLKDIVRDVRIVNPDSYNNIIESIYRIEPEDVLIGIGFSAYSYTVLKAMEYANSRNVPIIAITDDKNSPMTLYSSCNFYTKVRYFGTVKSLVAPISLINYIITNLCIRNHETLAKNLCTLGQAKNDYQVVGNEDIDREEDCILRELDKLIFLEGGSK